ncbi:hypothetical protein PYCCODRAFT_1149565 [Trametes coccinea BRFM310]|uniref:Uncharacterized protein n=1 Tax=Trametes coccinea (strain BRFM310) TaxID=1353009 RepID=A0A1Y2I9A9_TRAC3|nr:hypothetical protein PYCCODRAFT_1149565 [Trametes coccinea BRFM310]
MPSTADLTRTKTIPSRMNPQLPNFLLPVNLWEEVIDHCVPPPLGFFPNRRRLRHSVVESAVTLLACTLTCREWLARSLFNLYSVCVILEDSKSVDRLVEIITMRPHLALFVRISWVSPEEFLPELTRASHRSSTFPLRGPS